MAEVQKVRLVMLDMDGTLIRSFLREGAPRSEYDLVEVLPGRVERLRRLRAEGAVPVIVTNQGGVAFGYQSWDQVMAKLRRVCAALGIGPAFVMGPQPDARPAATVYVALGHPKATVPEFLDASDWRKPGGGMLWQAMRDHGVQPWDAVMVGDMPSDAEAASAAGVRYVDAAEFFAGGE